MVAAAAETAGRKPKKSRDKMGSDPSAKQDDIDDIESRVVRSVRPHFSTDPFPRWFEALEGRHLATLNFSEVRKAVQALSSLYVERRERIDAGAAFTGSGKRAAFAMYFGPLHFLLVREIVRALDARIPLDARLLDLGCGTGVAGSAWAIESQASPNVIGVDRNGWAVQECRWTYEQFGISGTAKVADVSRLSIPATTAVIAAFTINELDLSARERFRREFLKVARNGCPVLIIEPIARRLTSMSGANASAIARSHQVMSGANANPKGRSHQSMSGANASPTRSASAIARSRTKGRSHQGWWGEWASEWKSVGGREDDWRFRVTLPERLALMDKAAGLDHRELTGRSLWLPPLT